MINISTLSKLFLFVTFLIAGCDRPECTNTNPVFDKFAPNTEEYKTELAIQLSLVDKGKLAFWFSEYEERGGREYFYFDVQGDDLCAKIVLEPGQSDTFSELRKKKGVSFRGAEFVGLRFDILRDTSGITFIMKDFDRIID